MNTQGKTAFILSPSGQRKYVQPANGKSWAMEELQEIVQGYFERCTLGGGMVMYVNEDGHIKNLPLNEEATLIFMNDTREGQRVVGTVLITPVGMEGSSAS